MPTRGKKAEAEKLLADMKHMVEAKRVSPFFLAPIYVGLREDEKAIQALQQAYTEHFWGMAWIMSGHSMDPLRADPHFKDLMRQMKFPAVRTY